MFLTFLLLHTETRLGLYNMFNYNFLILHRSETQDVSVMGR